MFALEQKFNKTSAIKCCILILELISTKKCTRSFLISKFNELNQQVKGSTFALTLDSNPEQWNIRTIVIEGTKPVVPLCDANIQMYGQTYLSTPDNNINVTESVFLSKKTSH